MHKGLFNFLSTAAVFICMSNAADAQRSRAENNSGPVDPAAIAKGLRDVDVQMTDPDPDMRIGYLEAIVAEGNARKIERAIRIAVTGQDSAMRALGFRAYVSATKSINFDFILTPQERQKIADSHERRSNLPSYLSLIARANGKIGVEFEPTHISSMRGFVMPAGRPHLRSEYSMRGERLTFSGETVIASNGLNCIWEIRALKELKVVATLACPGWQRVVQLEADMF